jgi:hypothetical protein
MTRPEPDKRFDMAATRQVAQPLTSRRPYDDLHEITDLIEAARQTAGLMTHFITSNNEVVVIIGRASDRPSAIKYAAARPPLPPPLRWKHVGLRKGGKSL